MMPHDSARDGSDGGVLLLLQNLLFLLLLLPLLQLPPPPPSIEPIAPFPGLLLGLHIHKAGGCCSQSCLRLPWQPPCCLCIENSRREGDVCFLSRHHRVLRGSIRKPLLGSIVPSSSPASCSHSAHFSKTTVPFLPVPTFDTVACMGPLMWSGNISRACPFTLEAPSLSRNF